MFAILQKLAAADQAIFGVGTIEVLPDGFGYLRSMEANYLPGADDIYISPTQVRRFGLRTGDTVEGEIRAPKDGERYFAMVQINKINFDDPEALRHRINFDNLTPLYPDERLVMEVEDPESKDYTGRIMDLITPIGKGQRALIVFSGPRETLQPVLERFHMQVFAFEILGQFREFLPISGSAADPAAAPNRAFDQAQRGLNPRPFLFPCRKQSGGFAHLPGALTRCQPRR